MEYLLRFVLPGEAESVASAMSDIGNPNIFFAILLAQF